MGNNIEKMCKEIIKYTVEYFGEYQQPSLDLLPISNPSHRDRYLGMTQIPVPAAKFWVPPWRLANYHFLSTTNIYARSKLFVLLKNTLQIKDRTII